MNGPAERLYRENEGFAIFYAHNGRFYPPPGADWGDLVQQARLALWKAAQGFDPSRGVPFIGYADAVLENELSKWLRDRKRAQARYERGSQHATAEWEAELATWEEPDIDGQMRLRLVWRRLKPKQQAALLLAFRYGYTSGEVARTCGLTPKQADNLINYARQAAQREAAALDRPPPPPKPAGPPPGRRFLTPAEMAEIRAATGGRGLQARLAERYGVDKSVISRVRKAAREGDAVAR
jgi:RNA polymerase sigma factor (sigma-70 family)